MLAGIDEAGRGPVLGPLVVAGVAVPDDAPLRELGVRDSKRIAPANRERLARRIRALPEVRVEVRVIEPAVLDQERSRWSLNQIEMQRFQDIASCLGAATTYADAADTDAARFGRILGTAVPGVQVVAEHRADDRYPVVGAASIIAKVERDAAVAELGRRLERVLHMPLGSGYPSDELTAAFLGTWIERFGSPPEGARLTWETVKRLVGPKQSGLGQFP